MYRDELAHSLNYIVYIYLTSFQYNSSGNNFEWAIPITYTTESNPNFSQTLPSDWITPNATELKIDLLNRDDWIIVNLQRIGESMLISILR